MSDQKIQLKPFIYTDTFSIPLIAQLRLSEGPFMPHDNGCKDLHRVWYGGCGICGYQPTVEVARKVAFDYAVKQLQRMKDEHEAQLKTINDTLEKLGTDPFNLGKFAVDRIT